MRAATALGVLLFGFTASAAPPNATRVPESDVQQLHGLMRDVWEFTLAEDPLFASEVGDRRFADRLPEVRPADHSRRLHARRSFLWRLRTLSRAALPPVSQIDYDVLERILSDDIGEAEHGAYLIPITNRSGFHIEFARLPAKLDLRTVEDHEAYLRRLSAFADWVDQHLELMRAGIEAGWVLPAAVLRGHAATIEAHIVDDPADSLLYAPFRRFPATFSAAQRARLTAAGHRAIARSVIPGYRRFLEFMRDEYVPAARSTIAASALPGGGSWYEHRVRRFTTLDLSPEQVHARGIAEVERIEAEMVQVIEATDFGGSFAAFLDFLRTDPRFYASSSDALLREVAWVLKRMDGELPRLFDLLPRAPYGIAPVPDYIAPQTTTAYYEPPAGDGSRAGTYFVNTYALETRPLYEIEALSLHEAVPGHHLQIALGRELRHLAPIRRYASFGAFVEGWALYAERLGLEVGFYTDPYSDFGRLTYEMWRACRLVVDTGIHAFGWSRERAIEFMAGHTALSRHNIEREIDRYISWPGQALGYKIGELEIRSLRLRAERELGERFDLRAFHTTILGSGAVPLDVLGRIVDRWLATYAHRPDTRESRRRRRP